MNEKTTAYDLAVGANDLHCLTIALNQYIFDNASTTKVTLDSINGLKGIAKALLTATEHYSDLASVFESEH